MVYWLHINGNAVPPIVNERVGKDEVDAQFTYLKINIQRNDSKKCNMN